MRDCTSTFSNTILSINPLSKNFTFFSGVIEIMVHSQDLCYARGLQTLYPAIVLVCFMLIFF
jgi:hypothetical protein